MSKAETTAIIDAIRESVSFLMTNGMSIRQGISNSTQDAAHVSSLLAGYSSDIDAIIANIPDDPEENNEDDPNNPDNPDNPNDPNDPDNPDDNEEEP